MFGLFFFTINLPRVLANHGTLGQRSKIKVTGSKSEQRRDETAVRGQLSRGRVCFATTQPCRTVSLKAIESHEWPQ